MKRVCRSALLPFPPRRLYDLVNDVERYPDFLPWCDNARIVSYQNDEMVVSMDVRRAGIAESFTTRNTLSAPHRIQIQLMDGPFTELSGVWSFLPLGAAADGSDCQGCKVELEVHYEFSRALLGRFLGNFFGKGVNSMMDAFCQRAEHLFNQR